MKKAPREERSWGPSRGGEHPSQDAPTPLCLADRHKSRRVDVTNSEWNVISLALVWRHNHGPIKEPLQRVTEVGPGRSEAATAWREEVGDRHQDRVGILPNLTRIHQEDSVRHGIAPAVLVKENLLNMNRAVTMPCDLIVDPQDPAWSHNGRLHKSLMECNRHSPIKGPGADKEEDGHSEKKQQPVEQRHADLTTDVQQLAQRT
jgi:hypothetical protein